MGGLFLVPVGPGKCGSAVGEGVQYMRRYRIISEKCETGRLLAAYHSSASVYHNRIF